MPRIRGTERVVVVRTDVDGNVLDYDIVEQPVRSVVAEKQAPVYRSQPKKQSPKIHRVQTYEEEEEDNYDEETDNYDDQDNATDVPVATVPHRRKRRDPASRSMSARRRVRYVRPKSTIKIFEEKVDWNADRKVDTNNDEAVEKIRSAPKRKVFGEKLLWRVKPRVSTHNEEAIDILRRASANKRPIFIEKPIWFAESKVDTHNEEAVSSVRRVPKQPIYDEKMRWAADPKIDTHNEHAVKQIKSAPKPIIYDEKFAWPTNTRIDNYNEDYIKHKEREKLIQHEKSFVYNFPQERSTRPDRARIDHHNPEFVEHKKRQKSARLPPIEDQKLDWQKTPRINQRNDDYIERIRQKRSIPLIFREKLKWSTKNPRIDAHNDGYVDKLKEQTRPKIINQLPRWRTQTKIDTFNDSYEPSSNPKPVIVNEKLRWHARTKIDTGLESDPNEDEYTDDDADYDSPV